MQDSEYERLIEPIEDRMIQSIWRITRDPDDADDALQAALVTVWKRFRGIRKHPNPQALILRICINAAYDVVRKRSRIRQRAALEAISRELPASAPSAVEHCSQRELGHEISRAIGQLSRNQAAAVTMRLAEGIGYPEIAQVLGGGEATARKHVERGRNRLRELLAHVVP